MTVSGDEIVADAQRYMGVPYLWGGTDPNVGLDCSGLVQLVYRDLGLSLPRVSQQQALVGTAVPDVGHAQPGDLVFYGPASGPTHVGIYAGGGEMIDAPYTGTVVRVDPVGTPTLIRRDVADGSTTPGPVLDKSIGQRIGDAANAGGPGGAAAKLGQAVSSSVVADIKTGGAYVALVMAGLGLIVLGAVKTASPGTSLRTLPAKAAEALR
jgi:hypothetical protein